MGLNPPKITARNSKSTVIVCILNNDPSILSYGIQGYNLKVHTV